MHILLALPPSALTRLATAIPGGLVRIDAASWGAARHALDTLDIPLAVLDPALEGWGRAGDCVELVRRHPTLTTIVYTGVSAEAIALAARLGHLGVERLVVRGTDDTLAHWSELLATAGADSLRRRLVARLDPALRSAPPYLQRAVSAALLTAPPSSPERLATLVGITRRALDRALDRLGLAPTARLLRAGRLLSAYDALVARHRSVTQAARAAGYRSPRRLALHTVQHLGLRPHELRERLDPTALLDHLEHLVRTAAPAPARRGRVLVVDADDRRRTDVSGALRHAGFDPLTAATGEGGADLLRALPLVALCLAPRLPDLTADVLFTLAVSHQPPLRYATVFLGPTAHAAGATLPADHTPDEIVALVDRLVPG